VVVVARSVVVVGRSVVVGASVVAGRSVRTWAVGSSSLDDPATAPMTTAPKASPRQAITGISHSGKPPLANLLVSRAGEA
jgi:hypothetical protein